MVSPDIDTVPGVERRPVGGGTCPERVIGGKAEGQEDRHAEIDASRVDVFLSHVYLAAGIAYAKPAVLVEGERLAQLALDNGGEGTTHSGWADVRSDK